MGNDASKYQFPGACPLTVKFDCTVAPAAGATMTTFSESVPTRATVTGVVVGVPLFESLGWGAGIANKKYARTRITIKRSIASPHIAFELVFMMCRRAPADTVTWQDAYNPDSIRGT